MAEDIAREQLGDFHGIKAKIASHQVWGVPANALVLHLPRMAKILSGRQGFKRVSTICNFHIPEPLWLKLHEKTSQWNGYYRQVLKGALGSLKLLLDEVAVLSTGVDMRQLAWAEESYKELWVLAFVTAGVSSNAMRIGQDSASVVQRKGRFDPVGTINTIVFSSAALSQASLAASFITITEAKVIALEQLNIKSSYNPELMATGTGTDQIVVVSGDGTRSSYVGGHTKLGELMARAVTRATSEAVKKELKASE